MTRIDFYVLQNQCHEQRIDMACRLAEKAVKNAKRVFIHVADEVVANSVDAALWHFREDAFVPHVTHTSVHQRVENNANAEPAESVVIGFGTEPTQSHNILINLCDEVPTFFSRFERTLEIVNLHQHVRSLGRARYSFYQKRGYPLHHHTIGV